MNTDASLPELLDRVTALEGSQILRELQHKLDKIIARHHQDIQKSKPVRRTRFATRPASGRV